MFTNAQINNITSFESNYDLVFQAGRAWREAAKAQYDSYPEPKTEMDRFDIMFCDTLPELCSALGLTQITIGDWGALDALGMDDLEGPEYWDETALLYPCMMNGWTVHVWGAGQTTPTLVEGNEIIDVLQAAQAAITAPLEDGFIEQIRVNEDDQTIFFICD